jgi:hypothetical protein
MRLRSWTAYFHQISLLYWNNSWATNGSGGGASNLYLGPEERQYAHVLRYVAEVVGRPGLHVPVDPVVSDYDTTVMRAYGLTSDVGMAAYLHHYTSHEAPLVGQSITADVPRAGVGVWIDPATGQTLGSAPVVAGANRLDVPPFTIDIALVASPEKISHSAPLAVVDVHNPQADGDLDEDGQPDRGPPEPAFGLPPLTLTLDGRGSYDPDGGALTWHWSFGDGSPGERGPVAVHTYGDGNFFTTLEVTDDEGVSASNSFFVRAAADPLPDANNRPTLNALRDVTVWEGELVLITPIGSDRELVDGSYQVDGHTTETLAFHVEGLPSGATFVAPNGQGQPQVWWVPAMDQSGVYVVELWAEDPEGLTSERQQVTITVRDAPEEAPRPTATPTTAMPAPSATPSRVPPDGQGRLFLPVLQLQR